MEFFKKNTHINFMGIRGWTGAITAILWVASLTILMTKGLNFGLDFTGGTQMEVRFPSPMEVSRLKHALENKGFKGVRVQQYGSPQDILIRIANPSSQNANTTQDDTLAALLTTNPAKTLATENPHQTLSLPIKDTLKLLYPEVEIRQTEFVGSEVGQQLIEQGGIAVLVAILATMLYIAMRFEYRLAVSAAVGLLHDAVLILGVFALFGFEFDLAALASIMAVLGYSLNDTIVVFDRIRENFRRVRKGTPVEIVNLSINQTLSRTIMTSWMTLLVVLALLFFGGETLFGFSMAFFIGIIVGTFSSIYVSGALALWLGLSRTDLLPKSKVVDERP